MTTTRDPAATRLACGASLPAGGEHGRQQHRDDHRDAEGEVPAAPLAGAAPGVLGGQHGQGEERERAGGDLGRGGGEGGAVDQEEPGGGQGEGHEQAGDDVGRAGDQRDHRGCGGGDREADDGSRLGRAASDGDGSQRHHRQHHDQGHVDQPPAVVTGRQPREDEPVHAPCQAGAGERPPCGAGNGRAQDLPGPPVLADQGGQRPDAGGRGHEETVTPPGHEHGHDGQAGGQEDGLGPQHDGGGHAGRHRQGQGRAPLLHRPHRQQDCTHRRRRGEGVGHHQVAVEQQGAGQAHDPHGRPGQGGVDAPGQAGGQGGGGQRAGQREDDHGGHPTRPVGDAPAAPDRAGAWHRGRTRSGRGRRSPAGS